MAILYIDSPLHYPLTQATWQFSTVICILAIMLSSQGSSISYFTGILNTA